MGNVPGNLNGLRNPALEIDYLQQKYQYMLGAAKSLSHALSFLRFPIYFLQLFLKNFCECEKKVCS